MGMARRELFLALLCLLVLVSAGLATGSSRKMVGVYELRKGDFSVKVTNWGARLMSVVLPDSKGTSCDLFLLSLHVLHCWGEVFFLKSEDGARNSKACLFLAGILADVVLGRDTIGEYVVRSSTAAHSIILRSLCMFGKQTCVAVH
jgi:hypothetical protein